MTLTNILLAIHIAGGSIGVLTGLTALFLHKGSPWHRKFGNTFFIAMIFMSTTGAYMSLEPLSMTSFMAGTVTFYMIATAWRTARNTKGKNGYIELIGLLYALVISVVGIIACWELVNNRGEAIGGGVDPGLDFFLYFYTGIAILSVILDISVIYRGGIYGAQRIARHLWRMCFGLWVAIGSFFLGQPQVFPEPLRDMVWLRAVPFILVTFMLFFWLIRVYVIRRFKLQGKPKLETPYNQ